jgi:hypothetical protein
MDQVLFRYLAVSICFEVFQNLFSLFDDTHKPVLGACHLAFGEDAQPSVTQVKKKYILWNPKIQHSVRFQVLTPANLKMTPFWDIARAVSRK